MSEPFFTGVSDKPLSTQVAVDFVDAPEHGAMDMFVGRVRNHNLGRVVTAVSYDAFAPLAKTIFREICEEAHNRYGKRMRCYVEHFHGRLEIGGISIIIAVGTPHRDESFKACRYIIEEIKKRAPVWKQEHYIDGDSEWVQGHALCGHHHEHDHADDEKHDHCHHHSTD